MLLLGQGSPTSTSEMISSTEIPKSSILIVGLFRFDEELRTICTERTRTTHGQHRRPVLLQRLPVDDTFIKPCRGTLEFKEKDLWHFAKTWVARCLTVVDLSRNGFGECTVPYPKCGGWCVSPLS
jgi:hypothetical protein